MPLVVRTTGVADYLDTEGEATMKAMILGEPSAGKTRFASFWPSPIFADCEDGRMSIADRNVPYVRIRSTADMNALLQMLDMQCKLHKPPERQYKTLVIDTLDSYQRDVMQNEILKGRESMTRDDWGALNNKMVALVSKLMKLPMNIVVLVHTKNTRDDESIVREPRLQGDVRDVITQAFDLVGWIQTQWENTDGDAQLARIIKWFPEPGFPILKDRSGQLPRETRVTFSEDDYTQLFTTIYGDAFDALKPSETLEELETEEPAEPVEPHSGGPVSAKKAAKKAQPAPQPAPEPAEEPKPRVIRKNVPPAKRPAAPADFTDGNSGPAEASEPDHDEAVEVATQTLGATVVSEQPRVEAAAMPEPEPDPEPEPAEDALRCGTGVPGHTPVAGCGKDLTNEDRDSVNISLIKTKTYLCPDCWRAWKTRA